MPHIQCMQKILTDERQRANEHSQPHTNFDYITNHQPLTSFHRSLELALQQRRKITPMNVKYNKRSVRIWKNNSAASYLL